MKRPRSSGDAAVWVGVSGGRRRVGILSAGADGEGVEVVGQDRPGRPGPGSLMAFEAGATESVAALEMADAAFGADAELGQATVGLGRSGAVAAGDEQAVRRWQMLGDGTRSEAAIQGDLPRSDVEFAQTLPGVGQQLVLVAIADLAGQREDQAAGAAAGVLAQLGDLDDGAELVRLAQLALADRPRIGVAHRDQPVGDRLSGHAPGDLLADLVGALGNRLDA